MVLLACTSNHGLSFWTDAHRDAAGALRRVCDATAQDVARNRFLQLSSEPTQGVFFVLEGWLAIAKSTTFGQRQIVDFVLPGEVFDSGSGTRQRSSTDLIALTPSRVAIISQARWQGLLRDHWDLQEMLNRRMAASYSRIAGRLLRVGRGCADARLAYAICELCLRATDRGVVDGHAFHLPLTQEILGDFVGLSSVHVSRTLTRLRREKIVRTSKHMDFVIKNADRLAAVAEVDLDDLRTEIIPRA